MTKTAEKLYLWGRTYPCSPYKGVHPPYFGNSNVLYLKMKNLGELKLCKT